jgi:hypothetical protein
VTAPEKPPWRERYRAYVARELGSIDAWEKVNAEQGLALYPQMIENREVLLSMSRLFDVLESQEKQPRKAAGSGRR